ncbi:hypothetical protein [Marinicauda pacifica]|uniref:hypothetical protein n=1 Tax=Marinicauda pacifica TaxID=1133559 RepID=UPI0035C79A96
MFDHRRQVENVGREQLAALLAELHNRNEIDLFSVTRPEGLAPFTGPRFFTGQNLFLKIIPDLEATLDEMTAAVSALVAAGGADMASAWPNGSFREWCEKDQSRSEEVIARSLAGDEAIRPFLVFALQAVGDLGRILACMSDNAPEVHMSAVSAAARLGELREDQRASIYTAFEGLLDRGTDPDLTANILGAVLAVASEGKDLDLPVVKDLVRRCLADPSDGIAHVAARGLSWGQISDGAEILGEVLARLLDTNPKNNGTIQEIDTGLNRLLEGDASHAAINFAGRLVSKSGGAISLQDLSGFAHRIIESEHALRGYAIGSWLIYGDITLGLSLGRVVGLEEQPAEISVDQFNLTEAQKIKLCRRAIGFFLFHPVLAASVLVSVARTADTRSQQQISDLLYNPVLLNFSGKVRDYLLSIGENDPAYKTVERALKAVDELVEGFKAAGTINELRPSTNERFVSSMHEFDEQREVERSANEQSVFANMFHRSVVLYGNKTISYVRDAQGGKKRFETELQSHGFSYELPRLNMFDPVSLEFLYRSFISERVVE